MRSKRLPSALAPVSLTYVNPLTLPRRYVSSELARALGTAPSALLRQAIGDIMPQPWGTLHEAWIRSHSSQAGPGQFMAPPGSCRTGMAMVLGASHRIQGYYRMAITSPEDPDADESGRRLPGVAQL